MRLAAIMLLLAAGVARAEDEVERLLRRSDDLMRGSSSVAVMTMQVKTAQYERSMKLQAWSKGTERTLVRILEPSKDAGISTLKVDENLWNYLPKVDRTMKVPAGMMQGAWMGSHLTNDDLVRDARFSEDFTWTVDERPAVGKGRWVVTLVPRPDAPVVWGKIVAVIGPDDVPVETRFYDEKGVLVRTMTFGQVRTIAGRAVPTVVRLTPNDKPGEFTEMRYDQLQIDVPVDDGLFSLQALKP